MILLVPNSNITSTYIKINVSFQLKSMNPKTISPRLSFHCTNFPGWGFAGICTTNSWFKYYPYVDHQPVIPVDSLGTLHRTTVKGVHPGHWSSNQIHVHHTETSLFHLFLALHTTFKKCDFKTFRPPISQITIPIIWDYCHFFWVWMISEQVMNIHKKLVIGKCQSPEREAPKVHFDWLHHVHCFTCVIFFQKTIIC